MGYLYKHIRLDTNEVFYIGIGGFSKHEKEFSYKRAYEKSRRNNIWNKIISKTDYIVEIILENLSFKEACEKEIEFIKLYGRINLKTGILSNLTDGGEGSLNSIHSNETKEKLRIFNKGKKHSQESKKKMSEAQIGKIVSKETREKLSIASKGKKLSEYTKNKISESKKGKTPIKENYKHSEETKAKIGNANKGKIPPHNFLPLTEKQKVNLEKHKFKKGQIPTNSKKVICIETGIIYNSAEETERILNVKHVSCVCRGKRKSAGGFTFKYKND